MTIINAAPARRSAHAHTVDCSYVLMRAIAYRRDRLVGRQRGVYSPSRQQLIDRLAGDYDAVHRMALAAGLES